jgi:hypothetical protein
MVKLNKTMKKGKKEKKEGGGGKRRGGKKREKGGGRERKEKAYGIMKVLKERYKDKAVKYFYYDNTFRSKIYRAINSIFSYIVINKSFDDFFDSRVKFYHALEFMFVHLNMSRMITYYRDPSLNIPKPNIMNSYVALVYHLYSMLQTVQLYLIPYHQGLIKPAIKAYAAPERLSYHQLSLHSLNLRRYLLN